ncbi:MAG: hypothetical protein AB203_00045 [Parcubacteria bacterium C7867-008]|nr:MAG: hypothetical protein AB203_00045 [Parcubacteria bacterium C7867-008]
MIRAKTAGITLGLFLTLFLFAAALPVNAQTCNPACGSGKVCAYIGEKPTCLNAGTSGDDGVTDVDEVVVTAQAPCSGKSLCAIVNNTIVPLGNGIVALLFAVAFLLFIYGMFKYFFLKTSDAKGRAEGRAFMIWSIIGLSVMFSVWGLVRLLLNIIPT